MMAQENNPLACSDGIDNDGDGLIDCLDGECESLPNNGCQTCMNDGLSFADLVIGYNSNCTGIENNNPQSALGVSDFASLSSDQFVSLGEQGHLTLQFVNNLLVNSGNNNPDIWIFEIGPAIEPAQIDLRPYDQATINILNNTEIFDLDGDGFYEFDDVAGSTSSLDIDEYISGYTFGELKFDAVKITDIEGECGGSTSGADIDAVCALSTISLDCAGTVSGTALIDICGECLEPDDPDFNLSCLDCAGTPFGTAVIDLCFECLEPDDINFNLSCSDDNQVYIPNIFSPDDDGINDKFQIFKHQNINAFVLEYLIFNRWGRLIFEANNLEFSANSNWWDGEFKGKKLNPDVFVYYIRVRFQNEEIKVYTGDVTIVNTNN